MCYTPYVSNLSAADFLVSIDQRLVALEVERARLLALRELYAGSNSPPPPSSNVPEADGFLPIPDAERRKLIPDTSGRRGLTPLILEVAERYPGLQAIPLVHRVEAHISRETPISRANIRGQVRYLLQTGRLSRDDEGGYHAVPSPDTEAEVEGEGLAL